MYLTLAIVLLIAAGGCDRHISSRDPVQSLPDAPPTPTSVTAHLDDRAVTLQWTIADASGVVKYRAYMAEPGETEFTVKDSSVTTSLTITNLPLNTELRFQIAAVSAAAVESERSETVTITAGLLTLAIDDNDEYTNRRAVRVRMNAPSTVDYVMVSEDSLFADGTIPQVYQAVVDFTLSQGDGPKRVFARFLFDDGTESSRPVFDDIILDTRALIDSVYFTPVDSLMSAGDVYVFYLDAGGETGGDAHVSFTGVSAVVLHDDGNAANSDAVAGDGIYSGRYVVPVGMTVSSGQVTGAFTDAAGNAAPSVVALARVNIANPPAPVVITAADAIASYEVSIIWSQSSSGVFFAYRIYRDTDADVTESSTLLRTISSAGTTSFSDTTVADDTDYYYRVYVVDNSGLRSGSNVVSVTTPENTAPENVILAARLIDPTTVGLSWTMSEAADFESYRIYRGTVAGTSPSSDLIAVITSRTTVSFDDYAPFITATDSAFYRVYVYDRQGRYGASNEVAVSQ